MSHKSDSTLGVERMMQQVLDEVVRVLMQHWPMLKDIAAELVDTILCPKLIAKQMILLLALETGLVTWKQMNALIATVVSYFSSKSRLLQYMQQLQQHSVTQDDWMDLAERMDALQGNDAWRTDPYCPLYEQERISARIDEMVHLMRRNDLFELMFVLRGSIGRNKFGLLHPDLFTKALAGSKVLVESYHNVVCAALDYCCDAPVAPDEDPIPTDARLAFFNETRHAYGRTALLLSGGAALGFYHVGVVKTLMENGLMPRVIGGSSAGSIVCAMIGTRTDEECMHDLFQVRGTDAPGHSGTLSLNFFRPVGSTNADKKTKPTTTAALSPVAAKQGGIMGGIKEVYFNTAGAFHDAKRTLQGLVPIPLRHCSSFLYDVLMGNRRAQDVFKSDTHHFRECVRNNVGSFTFQEAFDRTGRILNIVVTPNNRSDPPRLLNYLTAPHVLVWSAAVASASLPGVFEANRLVLKEADGWERYESGGEQAFSDGSMEQDLPMQQLSEMFNVNHFVISQANPHAVMFASYNQKTSVWSSPITGFLDTILTFVKDQLRSWLMNLVEFLGARRIVPFFETQRNIGTQLITQEYEGRSCDISLIPWLNHRGLFSAMLHVIYNPSEAEFRDWIQAAERATWRYIPAIKSHIAEEVTLDRCVQRLRRRLIEEKWDMYQMEHQQQQQHTSEKADGLNATSRVPSFFTSPSLVNLGGLNVTDQPAPGLHQYKKPSTGSLRDHPHPIPVVPVMINSQSGWAGLGLRGNRSSGNLHRSTSDASGLFIDEDPAAVHHLQQQQQQQQQNAGEQTTGVAAASQQQQQQAKLSSTSNLFAHGSEASFGSGKRYLKTTSMAKFYYRKTGQQHTEEASFFTQPSPGIHKTTSDPFVMEQQQQQMDTTGNTADVTSRKKPPQRLKSKSYADFGR